MVEKGARGSAKRRMVYLPYLKWRVSAEAWTSSSSRAYTRLDTNIRRYSYRLTILRRVNFLNLLVECLRALLKDSGWKGRGAAWGVRLKPTREKHAFR